MFTSCELLRSGGGFLWLFWDVWWNLVLCCVEVKVKNFVPCWCIASIMIVSQCISTGSFRRGTGLSLVTYMFFRVVQCITAVLCKSLFEILYCVQRGNLGELFLIMIWVMSVVLLHLLWLNFQSKYNLVSLFSWCTDLTTCQGNKDLLKG